MRLFLKTYFLFLFSLFNSYCYCESGLAIPYTNKTLPIVMIDPAGHEKQVGRTIVEGYERGETFKFAKALQKRRKSPAANADQLRLQWLRKLTSTVLTTPHIIVTKPLTTTSLIAQLLACETSVILAAFFEVSFGFGFCGLEDFALGSHKTRQHRKCTA